MANMHTLVTFNEPLLWNDIKNVSSVSLDTGSLTMCRAVGSQLTFYGTLPRYELVPRNSCSISKDSCGVLQLLIWVKLPVSQLRAEAHEGPAEWRVESQQDPLLKKNTSLIGGDDIWRATQTCPPDTINRGQLISPPTFLGRRNPL